MKKIMFNGRYGLTEAVLQGRKTMTRRITPYDLHKFDMKEDLLKFSRYKVGEVVAIAQSYKDVGLGIERGIDDGVVLDCGSIHFSTMAPTILERSEGWNNKLFVKANLMPHHIKITDIKVERLQDISDEDCLKEGVQQYKDPFRKINDKGYCFVGATRQYETAIAAFAALIDKVSGKGTWERNPWVFAYEFELID